MAERLCFAKLILIAIITGKITPICISARLCAQLLCIYCIWLSAKPGLIRGFVGLVEQWGSLGDLGDHSGMRNEW